MASKTEPNDTGRLGCRGRLVAAIGMMVALTIYLVWQAGVSPNIEFLRPSFRGTWIVHPDPPIAFRSSPTCPETVFAHRFGLDQVSPRFPVRITALGDFSVTVNGQALPKPPTRNWKRGTDYDLATYLQAGQANEIRVTVQPLHAPPALLVEGPVSIRTGKGWTVALAPQFRAVLAVRALHGETYLRYKPVPRWKIILLIFIVAFAAYAFLPARFKPWVKPTTSATSRPAWWQRHGLTLLLLFSVLVVHGHNVWQYAYQRSGFDWAGHVEYIQYVAHHWRVPRPTEGWEMFQPPLYYFCAASVLKIFGSLKNVQVFSAVVGMAGVGLIWWILLAVFPGRPRVRALGLGVAAVLPMALYMNPAITNEVFAATLITIVLLVATKVGFRSPLPVTGATLLGGVCGLALLAKYTGVFVFVSVLVLLILRGVTERNTWRRAAVTVAVALAVGGWLYVRNVRAFGDPFIGNWNNASGFHYEQQPGYRTLGFFIRFGSVFFRPIEQSMNSSFWDGMYGSLWADSHGTFLRLSDARLRSLAELGLWLGLLPSLGVLIGFAQAVQRIIRNGWKHPYLQFLLTTFFTTVALISFAMEVPYSSTVKAFFALSLSGAVAVFGGLGLDTLAGRLGRMRYLLYANIVSLAGLSLYLYWYRGT